MAALEWLKETDTVQNESRRTRLKDHASALIDQYSEMLRSARVDGEVSQQVGELRSTVLAESMVQSGRGLMRLSDELQCDAIVGDHSNVQKQIASVASDHEQFAVDGHQRLVRVSREMRDALRELETSYYACSVRSG